MKNTYFIMSNGFCGGDILEQISYGRFIENDFPEYETFWRNFVVPLTNRSQNVRPELKLHFVSDKVLTRIRRTKNDLCIAQLHYTIITHLARAHEIKHLKLCEFRLCHFIEGITRLSSVIDVADELLERYSSPSKYDPWDESAGQSARYNWRKGSDSMKLVRDYRNKLVHGRINPSVLQERMYPFGDYDLACNYLVPKFDFYNDFNDWREVTNADNAKLTTLRPKFDHPISILHEAWAKTLGYLGHQWNDVLLK